MKFKNIPVYQTVKENIQCYRRKNDKSANKQQKVFHYSYLNVQHRIYVSSLFHSYLKKKIFRIIQKSKLLLCCSSVQMSSPEKSDCRPLLSCPVLSDPLRLPRQCLRVVVVVLLRPSRVHVRQPAEGRPPLRQLAETLLRVRVRAERTESVGFRTGALMVEDQQAVERGRCGVAVSGAQVLPKQIMKNLPQIIGQKNDIR